MSKFSLNKFFAFLLIILSFVHVADAQTEKSGKKNIVKKIIEKVDLKKDKSLKDESSKNADSEVKETPKGRLPVIIIPGLIGSELVNKNTGDKVWFDLLRAKDDDLRLPISPNIKANRDNLVPRDILRKIQLIKFTPEIEIYQKLVESLEANGYTEGKLDAPPENGAIDTFYIFPYDWRLDNVENAQNLLKKLDELRANLKNPKLKFNIVAHSMGGLIARYAAMYGKADLTTRSVRATWKGANYFNNISLIATPNGGSLSALNSLLNGFSLFGGGKLNLPFVQNLSKYDLFTIPSIYQLLPHDGMVRAYDENLKPIKVDIYNPATWEKYGWTAYTDEGFPKKIENTTPEQAKAYFRAVLLRAKLFQAALDAKPAVKNPIPIYYLGSECKPTMDGMILYKNPKDNKWKTEFEADSFTKSDGTKVSKEELEKVLYSPGDGVVPKRSLVSSLLSFGKIKSGIVGNDLILSCGEHNRLTGDSIIGKSLLSVLDLQDRMPKDKAVKTLNTTRRTNK
ncbi:hypothetical protein BH20ACI1_BH20ACI1_09990 [soil metagenome]